LLDSKMNKLLLCFLSGVSDRAVVVVDGSEKSFSEILTEFKNDFLENYGEYHNSSPPPIFKNDVEYDTKAIPSIPDEFMSNFTIVLAQKMRPQDAYYKVEIKDEKYDNKYQLSNIVVKVLDFLVDYGFQERWFMELSPVLQFVMSCIIKYHIASCPSCEFTVSRYTGSDSQDGYPIYRNSVQYDSHYNSAFYLKEIKKSDVSTGMMMTTPSISKDDILCGYIDSVRNIALDEKKEFVIRLNEIKQIADSINVQCLTSLITRIQTEIESYWDLRRINNFLLNYCMVFVLSKLLGIEHGDAFEGKNEQQIAFSYLMRYMLTVKKFPDRSDHWIRTYILRFSSSEEMGYSMWDLFQ